MEFPLIEKKWFKGQKSLAIVYPNLYYGGVYCLAPLIIYNLVNLKTNWACDRLFLDRLKDMKNYDLVGFTWQYELDLRYIKQILNKNKPRYTFAGGPCVIQNPKALEGLIDFFVTGDSEVILPKILEVYSYDKNSFFNAISKIPGVYVPKKNKINSYYCDLDIFYPLYQPMPEKIDKNYVFGRCFILEIERGCPFSCKFCALKEQKPRYRSFEEIIEILNNGLLLNQRNKVVIYSASFTHPKRKQILEYLIEKNIRFSVPSIKVEVMDLEILKLIRKSQTSLTIAPECGEHLRIKLGKLARDEEFFKFAKMAKELDFKGIKLYFMVGLPEQNEDDLREMVGFLERFQEYFNNIYASIHPYVSKPNTFLLKEFDKKEIKKQINYLRRNLNIKMKISSVSTAEKIYKIANFP